MGGSNGALLRASEVDPLYWDMPYMRAPDIGQDRSAGDIFATIREALRRKRTVVGIGRAVMVAPSEHPRAGAARAAKA